MVGRFADAFEAGDIDAVVTLLTDDAWLKMPPQPFEYQGVAAIGGFLTDRADRRGAPLQLVPTRTNGQPAFGCYFPSPHTDIARPYGLLVLTLANSGIADITWFADSSISPTSGSPIRYPNGEHDRRGDRGLTTPKRSAARAERADDPRRVT